MAQDSVDLWVQTRHPGAVRQPATGQRRVYRVPNGSPSAMKIWPLGDATQHERHVREVSALARLSHPGLPKILAHLSQVDIDGTMHAMYIEEWVHAPSITAQIGGLPLDSSEFGAFLRTALDTLAHLHSEGIVHRDISLGNVLWRYPQTYVIDLGLAKHITLPDITSTGQTVGLTRATASPEQLQGVSGDLRTSTDVYSLGVVSFIVATGQHPFFSVNEQPDVQTLLTRQIAVDFQTAIPPYASVIEDMLHPVALFRLTCDQVLERLQ